MKAAPKLGRFGNYELLSHLGSGGMAEVFKARVLSGEREGWTVALKRPVGEVSADSELRDRFVGEANLSKRLDHPNIVKVYDVGVAENTHFMAMELIDGRDLGQ